MDELDRHDAATSASAEAFGRDQVFDVFRECVAIVLGISGDEVTRESTLEELGADSFHHAQLAFELERRLMITVPEGYLMPGRYKIEDYFSSVMSTIRKDRRTST